MTYSKPLPLIAATLALGAIGLCALAAGAEPSGATSGTKKDILWFLPHTHWEGAVFITREDYLETGLSNILRALKMLKADPSYRFTLDQACYVKPFLERFPEEEAAMRKYIAEGRLAIVGGTDVMPDVNMPSGESFVRQILYGKGFFREKLGVDVTTGWQLDTFGHHPQMPQLLKLGGYKSFWFFRGVPDMDTPSEFLWEGIDGSRIPAFWLPQGYAHAYGSPQTRSAFSRWMKGRFDSLGRQCPFHDRVGLAGADVCEPEEHVPALVEQHNRTPDALEWKFAPLPKSLSAELTASGEVPQANFARVSEYEAETMSHEGGSEEADAAAGNQRTWVARPARDKPSFLVFGPYDELPPGKYLTVYRMKLLEATGKDIATVDASIGGSLLLGSRKLTAGDLPMGKFASVPLMIDVTERHRDGRFEFRVSWHGNASLALDSITVFRLEGGALKPPGPKAAPLELRIAVPADYEKVVAARPDRPAIKRELNPIFQGTYSSRIELKQQTRELERLLTTAEKLGVIGNWLGVPTDDQAVWRAWEPVLFNQAHDLASGVMTDRVYGDTLSSNYFSRRLAVEFVDAGVERVAAKIDTQGEGIPIVVWNTLGWARTDLAEADLGIADTGIRDLALVDSAGQPVPHQLLSAERYADGGLLRAKIAFIARDVSAMGHAVYHAKPLRAPGATASAAVPGKQAGVIENEHYRVAVHPANGAITSVLVKEGNWQALAGPAVVSREHDGGDLWELYQPLDGGSRIAMTRKQAVPQPGKAVFSSDASDKPGTTIAGPVFSEFAVTHPMDNGTFGTRVRVYAGLKRIDIHTQLVNNKKFVRYQALFPTSIQGGRTVHEVPFGAIERPAAIEFPAQNWADYGDGRRGVALLNRGMPGNLTTDNTMMLSLARATAIVAYGFGGGYGPGMSSDSGFELGKPLSFDYAVVPHAGDWREAGVYRAGLEFNNPLLVRKALPHAGALPKRWGLLEISQPNAVLSALKPGPNGTAVARIYEAAGTASRDVKIGLRANVVSAEEVNLMEDPGRKLPVAENCVAVDLKPFEIKTLKFQLGAAK